jgi:WD40 repeat protein
MWNIFTGKLNQVYEDPMNNEITALTIDVNMKRAFLGDNTGHIKNLNMKNGKLLKELEPHLVEINMLSHSLALNIVVSCSIDNVIKIHDDSELTESEVKKELFIQNGQIKCIAICEKYSRLAIGLSTGLIKFYDIEHFRYDSDLHNDDPNIKNFNDEVTCLAPLQGTEVIFCGNASGDCKFMVIPPSQMKFEDISTFCNSYLDKKDNNNHKIPVTCCDYDMERKLMFTGDQVGYIKCYDIKAIFDFCENNEMVSKKFTKVTSMKEVQTHFEKITVPLKWEIEAHKESLKHIHHVDIEPRIVISTGNDLHVKIFSAETGQYKDELKQISCKYKPVPIGIKYTVNDPFKSKSEQSKEEFIIYRKELEGHTKENLEDIENKQSK